MKSLLLCPPHRGPTPGRFLRSTRLFIGFLAVALALPAWHALAASGTVTFANHGSSQVNNGYTSNAVTSGEGVKAALYWSPLGSNTFVQIGAVANVGISVAGVFSAGTRTNGPATTGGAIGQFQVRAWSGAATTYEQALATPGVLIGQSAIIQVVTGNPAGDPPMPPGSLLAGGLQSFTLLGNGFPPLGLTCATNKIVQCGNIWTFDPPTTFGGCISNPVVTVLSTVTNGACPQVITRTWQAADGCGNSSSCSQTVTVVDTTQPILTCAGNKIVECGTAWTFDAPSAADACSGTNVALSVLSTVTNGACPQFITQTWLATDLCGNTNTCSQTVKVVDTTPPVLTCASNKTVECGTAWTFDPPAAFDTCSGTNVSVNVLSTVTNGTCPQLITRTWQAVDICGNSNTCSQGVTVVDRTPPVFTCATNKTVQCGTAWTFDPPAAFDTCSGTNVTVSVLSTVTNGSCPQFITQTWLATDLCGNTNICNQTVKVVDSTPPVLTCATNKTVQCGSAWTFDPPAAFDTCSGTNVTITVLSTVTNGTCPQVITQTWLATDSCGNTNTCSQTVTVVDTTPPILTCASNKTVQCGSTWTFDPPAAFDACCGTNVTLTILSTQTNGFCPEVVTRTWQATDCCSNVATCTQTVTVVVTGPPITPVIAGLHYDAAGAHIIIQTQPCYTYVLECKGSLSDPVWNICQTIIGDGTNYEFIDPPPLPFVRFYRVRQLCP